MVTSKESEQSYKDNLYTDGYTFQSSFFMPRFWIVWLLVAFSFVVGRLPVRIFILMGKMIGKVLFLLGGRRAEIARRNLELAYPDLDSSQREKLLYDNFGYLGVALIEPGLAWFSSSKRVKSISKVVGYDNVVKGLSEGGGVLICGLHMSCVEMACRVLAEQGDFNLLYRANDNELYEYLCAFFRRKYPNKGRYLHRKKVKDLLYFLGEGEVGAIIPDQDMGRKRSVFVPFLGQNAATVPSVSDFSRISNSKVVMGNYYINDNCQYVFEFTEVLDDFPTDDSIVDTARINKLIENYIKKHPEQYIWQHRRFKTRPAGEVSLY